MKLITKTILYYLLVSLPLLVIAGFASYYLIDKELKDGLEESLLKEKLNAEKLIQKLPEINTFYLSPDSISKITRTNKENKNYIFCDTIIYDKFEEENLNYHLLTSYYNYKNRNYIISVAKPTLEEDELMEGLLSGFVLIVVFLVIAFFVVSWLLSKTLWKPFYNTLYKLNSYDIKKHNAKNFEKAKIKEFNQLNESLNKMTEKIQYDFIQQKEFTENASHEMQTPLAVIKANVALLMQSPNLMEEEMNQIQSIDNTVKKLSALNKALLLLVKIENNQFKNNVEINVSDLIGKILPDFEHFIISKNIVLENKLDKSVFIKMNADLADIMLRNLIQNAIRHNQADGKIILETSESAFAISNSGLELNIEEKDLFGRFKKNVDSMESLGLGLSIVKSIANVYEFNIAYNFQNSLHTFTLKF